MRTFGKILGYCAPVMLFLGPIMISNSLERDSALLGGFFLGAGLTVMYFRIQEIYKKLEEGDH